VRSARGRPAADAALLPSRLRSALLRGGLLAACVLVPLCAAVAGKNGSIGLDKVLREPGLPSWMLSDDVSGPAARLLPPAMPLAALVLSLACWRLGERRGALLALAGPAAAFAATEVLKPLLSRPSGTGSGWMFPSGHVTVVAAVAAAGGVLVLPGGPVGRRLQGASVPIAWAAVLLPPTGTSLGTIVGGYHHPTDVLGGVLVAVVSVLTVAAAVDWLPMTVGTKHPSPTARAGISADPRRADGR
jgi:membrane-associated phospholipid phosphatase